MSRRIGISAEFVRPGRVGGAEHALRNLISGLSRVLRADERLVVVADFEWSVPGGERVEWVSPPYRSRNRFVQEYRTYHALGDDLDVMLYPSYATPPGKKRCRLVTVIQDLEQVHIPQFVPLSKRLWLAFAHRHTLRKADVTVAASDFVRRDILRHFGQRWESVTAVVPNPVCWDRFGNGAHQRPLDAPYVLCVAAHYPNKNLANLVHAFERLRRVRPEAKLVLVGQRLEQLRGPGLKNCRDVAPLVEELDLADSVIITGYLDDHEVGAYYRHARLLVLPSIFEGFGLPPVEALGFGCPVLTTRCTAIPEVTGDLAVYLDNPSDQAEIADKMQMILDRPEDFRPTEQESAEIRSRFNPARVAARYYELLTGERPAAPDTSQTPSIAP